MLNRTFTFVALVGGIVVGAVAPTNAQQAPPQSHPYYYQPSPQPIYPPPTHAPPAYGPTVGGAQFAQTIVGGQLFVQIRDQILPGDALRAEAFRRTLPVGVPVIVLLNSPGGSAIDSWLIAAMIRRGGASTYVVNDCESACFLMFAAGRQRGYASGARIGVHRASNGGGQETLQTEHGTVTLAKAYELLGVPPAIIGRMVTTEPGAMAFLTSAELASMGAVQIPSR